MTATANTAFATLATSLIGVAVSVLTKGETDPSTYKVASLSDKVGKLKDGTEAQYVLLQKEGSDTVTISMHPRSAQTLFTKGKEGGMTMELPQQAEAGTPEDLQAEANAELNGGADEGDATAAPAKKEKKAKAEVAAEPKADKAPSKKDQVVAIYKAGTAAGKARKDIIIEMKAATGLSDAGASTYYQNCKGGKWA